ncbi:MAG: SGNH/GDSL hydrolase family protein [Proteobacteria bacterium]|nr:SGNH/GDSL hydrolase family protein [Pseudomonadota bacterium]
MKIRTAAIALCLCGASVVQTASPQYPLEPPGHGENGDWAFLSRFRAQNAALSADPSRVVFFGDSITEGWGHVPFIAENAHYVARGIGGQTTQQLLVRFRTDVIDLKPVLVHIMAGTNDVAGNNGPESDTDIEEAIESMVELALSHRIKVVLASIPPAIDFSWHPGLSPAARIRRLNSWIKSYASRIGVGYVDYWPALATEEGGMKSNLSIDGVHPNGRGYKAMQPLAAAAIQASLGKP